MLLIVFIVFLSSGSLHTIFSLVTVFQSFALPISLLLVNRPSRLALPSHSQRLLLLFLRCSFSSPSLDGGETDQRVGSCPARRKFIFVLVRNFCGFPGFRRSHGSCGDHQIGGAHV